MGTIVRVVKTFRDLMGDHREGQIENLLKGDVVRQLTVKGDDVEIEAGGDKVTVPLDTAIAYEPWFMDRGSLVFHCPGRGTLKICTELDRLRVRVADGDVIYSIIPPESL